MKGLYIWKTSKNEKVRANVEHSSKGGKMDLDFCLKTSCDNWSWKISSSPEEGWNEHSSKGESPGGENALDCYQAVFCMCKGRNAVHSFPSHIFLLEKQ